MKIFGVTGWKNSGKTGLMERLITEFTARGLSVSSIKHAHHSFDVDHPGKDSHRHRVAGASQTLLASGTRWALMSELRGVEQKRAELDGEFQQLDQRQDGYAQMSIANGYLRYMQHRQEILDRQIATLKAAAETIQDDLRQTVFSQSVLNNS